ncbi:MAG TPA: GerAB/ArcD/ProY family transporter [Firmicutes bacterium]|nr:GerAB/ArcD/ProY family transporter [Bacillota bacterium]
MGESKTRQLLPLAAIIVISSALFSGHFGVGDTIFPPILGREAGQSWLVAAMGYGIINSLGVLIAYLAVSMQQQTLLQMASKTLGRWFGVVFTTMSMLIIGPVFILPRVSSATHEMAVELFFPKFPLWATLLIFFGLNFVVAYNRAKVIDTMGKLLAPVLIVFMAILVIKGIVSPEASAQATGMQHPLSEGVLNGYNTMNALGAALFGGWVLKDLALRGITDKKEQSKNLIYIGPIVAVLLLIASTGLTYLGASTGFAYDAEIGILTVNIAEGLLGILGKAVFAVLLALACFTTSVGLTSTAGDVFMELTGGKLKYEVTVGLSSLVGFLLGLFGLSKIIQYTTPWLMLLYPALVVILLSNLLPRFSRVKNAVAAGVVTAMLFSVGDFLAGLGLEGNIFISQVSRLPLGDQGMGWIIPTVVVFAVVQLLFPKAKSEPNAGG